MGKRLTAENWHRVVCMNGNGDSCATFRALKAKARICVVCDDEKYADELVPGTTRPICKACHKAA